MALAISNLINVIALTLQGDLAGWTTYTSKKRRIVFFPVSPPRMPATPTQFVYRARFQTLAQQWTSLSEAERNDYATSARYVRANITGYNLWMKAGMTADDQQIQTVEQATGIPLTRPWRLE